MRSEHAVNGSSNGLGGWLGQIQMDLSRKAVIGIILIVALLAFEVFNFDTTRYALINLMGEVRFLGFQWAAILAIAFCSIDFAGLVRLFTPEKGRDEPREVWYLMGAWLLGATMNALMTWWAVSLTLLNHDFGNEVLSREQLLTIVPIFVAVLVWLTRILFIGAFTVAGEHIFGIRELRTARSLSAAANDRAQPVKSIRQRSRSGRAVSSNPSDVNAAYSSGSQPVGRRPDVGGSRPSAPSRPQRQENSRIRQRPPMPGAIRRVPLNGVQARRHN